jgi:hypothetical protein
MDHTSDIMLLPEIGHTSSREAERTNNRKSFIEANTIEMSFEEMKNEHIIPVFVKDNETLISHTEFIETAKRIAVDLFPGETILKPDIRLSHPIKGRVPEAKDKSANELLPWEKTIYYERMAFIIEIPSIQSEIDGNLLSLTLGGVKSFAEDNLYSRSQSDQHFKFFIGFKNTVCTNLCVWTDGYLDDAKVKNIGMLKAGMSSLVSSYNENFHLQNLKNFTEYSITEQQFSQIIGKCRMYQHLPQSVKNTITPILFGDQQMGAVVKDYYKDRSFCKDQHGRINLWKLYNLFTGVNKNSYIDSFLERSVNAYSLVEEIRCALDGKNSWYLN